MTDRPDPQRARDPEPSGRRDEPGASPGYAFGQLAKALQTAHDHRDADTRHRADRKASDWLRVVGGMLSGALRIGRRAPVRGVPVWATTRVVAGGFATGDLEAGGPLRPHERARLATFPPEVRARGRAALNASFLTDDGLDELAAVLEAGTYRVGVPEEGALLAVAWLARNGGGPAARRVLDEVGPWFDRLRFYPAPADGPPDGRPDDGRVRLADVGAVARRLERKTVPADLERQTEAYAVWLPHYDRVVGVLAETVSGPAPTLAPRPGGPPAVEGGWPFQTFPDGWRARAAAVLGEYAALRAGHPALRKPDRPGDNPVRLRSALEAAVRDPSALTGLEVGRVRAALAGINAKRGLPGSDRLAALRAEQARVAGLPTLADWARALAGRLGAYDPAGGLPEGDLEALLLPVGPAEAERYGLPPGEPVPDAFRPGLLRAVDATPEQHVAWGTIPSAEALARVVPALAAPVRSAGLPDPALRRLDEAVYHAFRRRRSVLLLDLQSQARLAELPWVAALEPYRVAGPATVEAARATLGRVVGLALGSFPHQILPNKLLQEVRALAETAGLGVPLVNEIAADIFTGTFTAKYLRAAQAAADVLEGSVYERYYGVDYAAVRDLEVVAGRGAPTSPGFARLCYRRAGQEPPPARQWGTPAENGAVIEQGQVLTTHNLAPLFGALDLEAALGRPLADVAGRTFGWVADALEGLGGPHRGQRRTVKNAAYAWRQFVFFLSLLPGPDRATLLEAARRDLHARSEPFVLRFGPVLNDLIAVASDDLAPRPGSPFYGWSRSHPLVVPE